MKPLQLIKLVFVLLIVILILMVSGTYFFYSSVRSSQATTLYDAESSIRKAEEADYENCIVLRENDIIRMSGQERIPFSYQQIASVLRTDTAKVRQASFRIIITRELDYQHLSDILLLMPQLNTQQYEVLKQ
jgi:hypothetical protein